MARRGRKNFLPTLILIFFFWITFAFIIFLVDPEEIKDFIIPNYYLPFFINLFLALFFTLAVIFSNSRKGFLVTLGIVIFLILRLHSLGNMLNAILLCSCVFSLEYYFTRRN